MLSQEPEGCQILIALEGPDYTGKSTLAERLVARINTQYAHLCEVPAVKVSRPGGTLACGHLREVITNSELPSLTRQSFALAEEVLFRHSFETRSPIVIFDRYNPVSGQIYGPEAFAESWRLAVSRDLTHKMDRTIFVQSGKETILKRAAERNKRDMMDDYFQEKIDHVLNSYEAIRQSQWAANYCNPYIVRNDGEFEIFFTQALKIVTGAIDERLRTVGI